MTRYRILICALTLSFNLGLVSRFNVLAANVLDDFNDNALDTNQWASKRPYTDDEYFKDSLVEETGGRLQLTDRGYLVTKDLFDPLEPLVVTGQAILNHNAQGSLTDVFSIAIRTNAVPATSHGPERFGEVDEGIVFTVRSVDAGQNAQLAIHAHDDGVFQGNLLGWSVVPGIPVAGVPFNFMVTDDGENLRFSIWATGAQSGEHIAEATSLYRNSVNGHVAFYNRETAGPGSSIHHNVVQLDNIAIVPEPATVSFSAMAILVLIACSIVVRLRRRLA